MFNAVAKICYERKNLISMMKNAATKNQSNTMLAIVLGAAIFAEMGLSGVFERIVLAIQNPLPLSSVFNYNTNASTKAYTQKPAMQKFENKYAILALGEGVKNNNCLKQGFEFLKKKGFTIIALAPAGEVFPFKTIAINKKSFYSSFEAMNSKATDKDLFFFAFFGHGMLYKPIDLHLVHLSKGDDLDLGHFLASVAGNKAKEKVFLFTSCFSGGFAEALGKENTAISLSTPDKIAFETRMCKTFGENLFDGLENYSSVGAAFDYATAMDSNGLEGSGLLSKMAGAQNTPELISHINPYSLQF